MLPGPLGTASAGCPLNWGAEARVLVCILPRSPAVSLEMVGLPRPAFLPLTGVLGVALLPSPG